MLSVTTKTGDQGQSGLANGQRLPKADPVFEAIGTLDELNSWLGLVCTKLDGDFSEQQQFLYQVQTTLFDVGAEVARSPKTALRGAQLQTLEDMADSLQQTMEDQWHTKFLLPGGTESAAVIDIARTVCRRCERVLVAYAQTEQLSPLILKYLNRLSDYLYILRCHVNAKAEYSEKQFIAKK